LELNGLEKLIRGQGFPRSTIKSFGGHFIPILSSIHNIQFGSFTIFVLKLHRRKGVGLERFRSAFGPALYSKFKISCTILLGED
jgi:hypothetical protein